MTRRIEMVAASIAVSYAARIMIDQSITGMPVTNDDGGIIGMLCAADLLRAVSGMGSMPPPEAARGGYYTDLRPSVLYAPDFIRGKLQGTVREYMSSVVVTLSTDDTVQGAASTMMENGVTHALVLDKNDNLAGILTAEDIMRHVAG
jgi:CBS domain-containing protein